MWPENTDGTYPEDCSTAPGPSDPAQYADLYPEAGLLEHEWKTHGTCSGLAADAFFTQVRAADHAVVLPTTLERETAQLTLSPCPPISTTWMELFTLEREESAKFKA